MTALDMLCEWHVDRLKRRGRLLLLLDAAERAAVTPISSARLHGFAYLADVLSPVWNLPAFDGKILKIDGGPHYPDLQKELDHLVVMDLVQVFDLRYVGRGADGARIEGSYGLNFESDRLNRLLSAHGAENGEALVPEDRHVHKFFVELAGALATVPGDEIDRAATADVTYRVEGLTQNVVDFAEWPDDTWSANPSWRTSERFQAFMPRDTALSPGEKLFLYTKYLARTVNAA